MSHLSIVSRTESSERPKSKPRRKRPTLADRIAELEKQLLETTSMLVERDDELQRMRQDPLFILRSQNERLQHACDQLTARVEQLEASDSEVDDLRDMLKSSNARVGELESMVDSLEDDLEKANDKIGDLEAEVESSLDQLFKHHLNIEDPRGALATALWRTRINPAYGDNEGELLVRGLADLFELHGVTL